MTEGGVRECSGGGRVERNDAGWWMRAVRGGSRGELRVPWLGGLGYRP